MEKSVRKFSGYQKKPYLCARYYEIIAHSNQFINKLINIYGNKNQIAKTWT